MPEIQDIDSRLKALHDISLIWFDWYENKVDAYESMWRIQKIVTKVFSIEATTHEAESPNRN